MATTIDTTEPMDNTLEQDIRSHTAGSGMESYDASQLAQRGAWSREQLETSANREELRKVKAYNNGVDGILNYYGSNVKFAEDEIARLYPTSKDYKDSLVQSGKYQEGDEGLAWQMDNYVKTQLPRLDKKYQNYFYYGMDVMGLDNDASKKFADDMIGKDQNDIVDSGYREWLPAYLQKQGDTETLNEFKNLVRDSTRSQIRGMRIADTIEYAKQNNLRYAFKKDPQTGDVDIKFVDVNNNIVDKPQQAVINVSAGKAYYQEFRKEVTKRTFESNMMAFLSDTNKANPEMKGKALGLMQGIVVDMARRDKRQYGEVLNDMKAVQGRPRMSDEEFFMGLYQEFDSQLKQQRKNLENGAIQHDVDFRNTVSSQIGNMLGLQARLKEPIGEDNLGGAFTRLSDTDAYSTAVGIIDQMKANNMDVNPENIARYLANEASKGVKNDDMLSGRIRETAVEVAEPVARSIYGKFVAQNLKQAEVIRKEQEAEKQKRLGRELKEGENLIKEQRKNGDIYVGALSDGAKRNILEKVIVRNGVADVDLARKMGVEYDEQTKTGVTTRDKEAGNVIAMFDNSYKKNNREVLQGAGDNVIVFPKDGKLSAEEYGTMLVQYNEGIGDKEQLVKMKALLNNSDNMSHFLHVYAESGVNYAQLEAITQANPMPTAGRYAIDSETYRKYSDPVESLKLFKSVAVKPNATVTDTSYQKFKNVSTTFPKFTEDYVSGRISDEDRKMVDDNYNSSITKIPAEVVAQMNGALKDLFASTDKDLRKYAYYVAMKKADRLNAR